VNAVDYLVKPVAFERFRAAVNKVLERLENASEKQQVRHIMVRANKKNYRLDFEDILYLEAQGDYVKLKTKDSSLLVHGTLKQFLLQLPENEFLRIHKSFVISLNKVVFIEGNRVKIGDEKLPVSLKYKDNLLLKLG
jgi:DNA-binding LytR/AlgR family response regulator